MDTKGPTKSVTLWGGAIITVLVLILPALGKVDLATVLQAEQAGILDWLSLVGGAIGSFLVFYGRLRKAGGKKLVVGG